MLVRTKRAMLFGKDILRAGTYNVDDDVYAVIKDRVSLVEQDAVQPATNKKADTVSD